MHNTSNLQIQLVVKQLIKKDKMGIALGRRYALKTDFLLYIRSTDSLFCGKTDQDFLN